MTSSTLRIAVPKGRIARQVAQLWQRAQLPWMEDDSRKLLIALPEARIEFVMAKPVDVATYVEYGVADVGIVGKDMLIEHPRDVYELLDLRIGQCRMCVIGLPAVSRSLTGSWHEVRHRVATKYPHTASQYFREQGQQVEIIPLNGSIELAPLVGLADRIVDLVETGATLRDNGLTILDTMATISSRLICNRASFRMKQKRIAALCEKLSLVIDE